MIKKAWKKIGAVKKKINQKMGGRYYPRMIALCAAAAAALLMTAMLFVPSYLGVADDGSLTRVMQSAGLSYIEEIEDSGENIYFDYFIKSYSVANAASRQPESIMTSHVYMIRLAVWVDYLFTGDNFFDIRFLALLYGILYVPGIYLLVEQACLRTKSFSEGIAAGLLGLLIFSDVAYITYFNSFYPEVLWFISMMYCMAAVVSFQIRGKLGKDIVYLLLLLIFAAAFTISKRECSLIGIVFAVFILRLFFIRAEWRWKVGCVLSSLILIALSFSNLLGGKSDFTQTSKYHAMTRGVLFTSDNPAETLEEFGISSSYEILADVSGYEELPVVDGEDEILREGFLDKYMSSDIALYYMKHPVKFINMLDISIKSCFGIRRDFCGNYEESVGLPEAAKSAFWSGWSRFKAETMPKTIGYLVLLLVVSGILFGKGYSVKPEKVRSDNIMLDAMIILGWICLIQSGVTIIGSGDAEMIRHCFPVSCSIDMMTYFIAADLIHRTKIL